MSTVPTKSTASKRASSPVRIGVEHVPTPALVKALRDLKAGRYVIYDSSEAVRVDIEYHKKKLRRR